jgi:hypothetical protein
MSKEGNHHYLPIFYLKQWAGSDRKLCEFKRRYHGVLPKRVSPAATGYMQGLYSIEDTDPDVVNAIETKFLMPADGFAAEAMRDLVLDRPFQHPVRMRHSWTRFVLSLMIRYPEAIAEMKRQLRANVVNMYIETKEPNEPATFAEYEALHGTNELARLHGKLMMDLMQDSRMGRLIYNMYWGAIRFSNYEHDLLTSDRPVASNVFPLSANHLCLPIGPEHLFIACETERAETEFRRLKPDVVMLTVNDLCAFR